MNCRNLATLFEEFEETLPKLQCAPKKDAGVTIGETEDAIFVDLPLPGVPKEKIQISYEKGILHVDAIEEEEKSEMKYHMKASRNYSFRIGLPAKVDDQSTTEASYKDGILRVKFLKSRAARSLKISIG